MCSLSSRGMPVGARGRASFLAICLRYSRGMCAQSPPFRALKYRTHEARPAVPLWYTSLILTLRKCKCQVSRTRIGFPLPLASTRLHFHTTVLLSWPVDSGGATTLPDEAHGYAGTCDVRRSKRQACAGRDTMCSLG